MSGVSRRCDARGARWRAGLLLGSALILGLTSCGNDEQGAAQTPAAQTAVPTDSFGSEPTGDSGDNGKASPPPLREQFQTALKRIVDRTSDPSREQIESALTSAGFAGRQIEVSNDTTPTGLEVDALEVAARVDGKCLVGQLRGGEVSISIMPVLATGKCFVGDQR